MARGDDRRDARRAGSSERDQRHKATGGGTHLNIPSGVELFSPEPGKTYRMDMSLYKVGKHNPFCRNEGWLYYELTYFIHGRVGPNNEVYCCPSKMRHEPCPICEYRAKLENSGPPKGEERKDWWKREVLPFMPKERQLWLPHVRGNEDDKVMLWDVSHFTFGKLLDQLRKAAAEDEDYKREFDDPKGGACLGVTFTEESGGGFTFTKAVGIEFKPRPKGMNPALLDHGIDLEAVPIVATYDEIKRAFYQEEDDHDEPKEKASAGRKAPAADDDDDWDDGKEEPPKKASKPAKADKEEGQKFSAGQTVRHRKLGVCSVLKVSGDGTSLVLEDSDGDIHKAQDAKDVRPVEDEKPKKAIEAKASKAEPPPDDDDDGWDDEPAPAKASGKGKAKPAPKEDDWDDDEPNDDPKPAKAKREKAKAAEKDEDDGWD